MSNNPSKEVSDFMKTRRRRDSRNGPMVYMIAEGSADYKPELNKPFKIADFQALDEYVNKNFTPEERAKLNEPKYFYQVTFDKPGGLVMPIIVEITFEDGTKEKPLFPGANLAHEWQRSEPYFCHSKAIAKIVVDPKEKRPISIQLIILGQKQLKNRSLINLSL